MTSKNDFFWLWSYSFRKWPLEVTAHEEVVQIIGFSKPLGSLGKNQSESEVPRLQGDLQKWHFWLWSYTFRKWPLEVTAHEEVVQIIGFSKPLGSLGKNQSESEVPHLQGDLQKWHFWLWSQRFRIWSLEVMAHEEVVQIIGFTKPLGSLGKDQSESEVPCLQGDLQMSWKVHK